MGSFRFGSFVAGAACSVALIVALGSAQQPPQEDETLAHFNAKKAASDKLRQQAEEWVGSRVPMMAVAPKGGWVFVIAPSGRGYVVNEAGHVINAQAEGIRGDLADRQSLTVVQRDFNFRLDMQEMGFEDFILQPKPKNGP